ncbi:MAG: hypothetical protein LQ340_000315 [Diploschistes diacapsis]|nr:MAG: hypothetical protein LQ340_000315 [Diploschistes diacapsis]
MASLAGTSIRRIAIIGGGPSGIATAKYLLAEDCFSDVQVFEQSDSVEGAWRYSALDSSDRCAIPQTSPFQPLDRPKRNHSGNDEIAFTTPMYDNLETNIPHQLMRYSHKPFQSEAPLYPHRSVVSRYLKDYAADVVGCIRFHTQVQDLHFLQNGGSDAWSLRSLNLCTGEVCTQIFDAVAVCSGHYNTPYIPQIPGIQQWAVKYPGSVSHSKLYRTSNAFKEKKTVIVGNSASGVDIANQISQMSKHPVIMSSRSESRLSGSQSASEEERIMMKPQISEFISSSEERAAVRFADGHVEKDVDCVLFYHPSLAFIALPIRVIPFPLSEVQAAVVAKVWAGRLALPQKQQMHKWEKDTAIENGMGKKFLTLDGGKDFKYHNELFDWANTVGFPDGSRPHRWTDEEYWIRRRFPDIKKAYAQRGADRTQVMTLDELGFDYKKSVGRE